MLKMKIASAIGALIRFAEGDPVPGTTYSLNLQAAEVTKGFFQVIADNILPILGLMGIMLGVTWVLKRFRKARKGSV